MKRILILTLFLIGVITLAQDDVPNPGGGGTDGFGVPASPLDYYIYLLLPLAISLIVYIAYRYRKQLS